MPRATELRVGRCGCILHDGRLLPERIMVRYRTGKKRKVRLRKKTFTVREILIPDNEGNQRVEAALYENHIHVFVDSHFQENGCYHTFYELCDIVPIEDKERPRYITYKGEGEYATARMWREWLGPFPSLEERERGLIRLLQRWNRRVPFRKWLRRMSPRGWSPPILAA